MRATYLLSHSYRASSAPAVASIYEPVSSEPYPLVYGEVSGPCCGECGYPHEELVAVAGLVGAVSAELLHPEAAYICEACRLRAACAAGCA